jgi:hypothetical protein
LNKIRFYLKRIFRLALSYEKKEAILWSDLKKLHIDAEWRHGIYEKDKYIETTFEIADGLGGAFYYMVYDSCFHCRIKIMENYPTELTTDLFILAAHFNNLLNNGIVIVNVNSNYIEYHQKRDLLVPLLYTGEIHDQIIRHYKTAKDIYAAFQRLVTENEAPAIIIADLLNKNEKKKDIGQ